MFLNAGHFIPEQQRKINNQQHELPAVWEKLLVSESLCCITVSISIVTTTTAAAATLSVCQSVERLTEEQKS